MNIEAVMRQVLAGLATIKATMVTKKDLENFITKEDAKQFATKEDLSQTEFRLAQRMSSHQESNIKHHLETKAAIGTIEKRHRTFKEKLSKAAK